MFQKKINLTLQFVTKKDLLYFLYSVLFYELFFKLTRRYYFVFENTLEYYLSLFSISFVYTSYTFILLAITISFFSILFNKIFLGNYYFSNVVAFILTIYLFKISDFPRSNFLYLLILFPVFYIFVSKLNFDYTLKYVILIVAIIISVSNQTSFFDERQISFLSNITPQDIHYEEINVYQNRSELYNKSNEITEFRNISFNDEVLLKEFTICCSNISWSNSRGKPLGYIEKYEDNLIYISATGDMFYMSIENLINESISNFTNINTNFKELVKNEYLFKNDERFRMGSWESVRDIIYDDNFIYVSYIDESEDDCASLSIIKGEVNLSNIEFSKVFTLNDCIKRTSEGYQGLQSGGAIENYDQENLILTTGDFRQYKLAQDKNSSFGKTLKINKNDGSYEVLSIGHRNPQGIKKIGEDLFISTEHGPRMGDEINLIDTSKVNNYGWPISSYGVHYQSNFGLNFNIAGLPDAPLYKSHEEYGFIEPVYYFGFDKVVEHGISAIEIIENNEKNIKFIFGSLTYGRFYLASYDMKNLTFDSLTSYNLGNRVRDIVKIDKNKYASLLEDPSRIAIISLNSD